jgi:signal transduction histidine kinase
VANWRSIRFRLSVQYSAVVFGLGGALLGLVYLAVQSQLRAQTVTAQFLSERTVIVDTGQVVVLPRFEDIEVRAIESVFRGVVLDEVARFTVFGMVALFLLSLAVGWVMSGRVLKPIEEITGVAREIQAFDLSRRIALAGPDDELKRLADTFDGMLDRLDRAFNSQRRFLADTSHDLRTPLTVIRSNVELVSGDRNATVEEWERVGAIIQRNIEKMSRMIDDLLAAARLHAGRAQAVTIDLEALVRAKAEEYRSIATAAGLRLAVATEGVLLEGVEMSLDRAISNLLDNARKVAPPGSTITVGCGLRDGWAWIAVADQGPGIMEDISNVVGLGLSIVFGVAEGHGGTLGAFNQEDGGTVMVVWIPVSDRPGGPPRVSPLEAPPTMS